MKIISIYNSILLKRKVNPLIFNESLKCAIIILFINIAFHSLFSLQVFMYDSYPSMKLLTIADEYYYLVQAVLLVPLTFQLYFIVASVIYLFTYQRNQISFEDVFKICVYAMCTPITVIFAIPCILSYLLLGSKMAVLVPFFSTAAFIFGYCRLCQYLKHYCREKVGYQNIIIFFALIFGFSLEAFFVR